MKGFLPDENIPRNVTFTAALPVIHARDLGASVSDTTIWQHARSNGLVYCFNRMKGQSIAAHVTLTKGERSRLAELAADLL